MPPTGLTQEFGINFGHTVLRKICKQQCGRLHTATSEDSSAMVLTEIHMITEEICKAMC